VQTAEAVPVVVVQLGLPVTVVLVVTVALLAHTVEAVVAVQQAMPV